MTGAYVRSVLGRGALLSPRSGRVSRHLAWMLQDTLRLGLPAGRRHGALRSRLARLPDVASLLAPLLRCGPRRAAPDIDAAVEAARAAGFLGQAGRRDVEVLSLQRGDGRLVLCFANEPWPTAVGKLPAPGNLAADRERAALLEARPSGVAPCYLGEAGGGLWQRGLPGRPLRPPALPARHVRTFAWPGALDAVAAGVVDLARASMRRGVAAELEVLAPVERSALLTPRARRRVAAARGDLATLERTVLRHNDLVPQNCLFKAGALTGFVDWETAVHDGVPGFDLWLAAISYFEHALGVVRWSGRHLTESFACAWGGPYFASARAGVRRLLERIDIDPSFEPAVTIGFFGYRVGRRLGRRSNGALGSREAATMLERVCRA